MSGATRGVEGTWNQWQINGRHEARCGGLLVVNSKGRWEAHHEVLSATLVTLRAATLDDAMTEAVALVRERLTAMLAALPPAPPCGACGGSGVVFNASGGVRGMGKPCQECVRP